MKSSMLQNGSHGLSALTRFAGAGRGAVAIRPAWGLAAGASDSLLASTSFSISLGSTRHQVLVGIDGVAGGEQRRASAQVSGAMFMNCSTLPATTGRMA
jgi:hypothetical protein